MYIQIFIQSNQLDIISGKNHSKIIQRSIPTVSAMNNQIYLINCFLSILNTKISHTSVAHIAKFAISVFVNAVIFLDFLFKYS